MCCLLLEGQALNKPKDIPRGTESYESTTLGNQKVNTFVNMFVNTFAVRTNSSRGPCVSFNRWFGLIGGR
jgi:hypothetical protein